MNGTTSKPIPRMKTGRDGFNMIFRVYAAAHALAVCEKTEERRFRAIPNGWRDLRMCRTTLDRLADSLVMTVPPEKLPGMLRMTKHMKYKVVCGPEISQMGADECVIREVDLNALCRAAHEKCEMCIEGNCNTCPLGKTFDAVMMYDRDGGSWSNVDFDRR